MKKITFILLSAILVGCNATPKTDSSYESESLADDYYTTEVYPLDELDELPAESEYDVSHAMNITSNFGSTRLGSHLTDVNTLNDVDTSYLTDMQVQLLGLVDNDYKVRYEELSSDYVNEMTSLIEQNEQFQATQAYLSDIEEVQRVLDSNEGLSEYEAKELKLNLQVLKLKQEEFQLEERYEVEVRFAREKANLKYAFQTSKFGLEINHQREVSQILMEGDMSQFYGSKLEDIRLRIISLEAAIEALESDAFGWGDEQSEEEIDETTGADIGLTGGLF